MTTAYADFLSAKRMTHPSTGLDVDPSLVNPRAKDHQRDLIVWTLRKGVAGNFWDAGCGKTLAQLETLRLLCQLLNIKGLILAPLAVARQTVREGEKFGIEVRFCRHQSEVSTDLTITNYEMMEHFDPDYFGAVALDESSILKNTAGVYRNKLNAAFAKTPFRFPYTATPAPNDIQEITNHSDFLDILPRRDVLATFFTHMSDDARASGWRLKPHARPAFWQWLASWAMAFKKPSDLGYSDEGYDLPPLTISPLIVDADVRLSGRLFADKLHGVTDRAQVRRQTLTARVDAAGCLIDNHRGEPWIAWCGLNDESTDLASALGSRAILVEGSQSPEEKAELLEAFIASPDAVLVTKPSIAGFGMNFQHAAKQAFVGLSDSYEQYYQCIRRSYRYGQTRPVEAHVVLSEPERDIFENVLRKEHDAEEMTRELVKQVAAFERAELGRAPKSYEYEAAQSMRLPSWIGARN